MRDANMTHRVAAGGLPSEGGKKPRGNVTPSHVLQELKVK